MIQVAFEVPKVRNLKNGRIGKLVENNTCPFDDQPAGGEEKSECFISSK